MTSRAKFPGEQWPLWRGTVAVRGKVPSVFEGRFEDVVSVGTQSPHHRVDFIRGGTRCEREGRKPSADTLEKPPLEAQDAKTGRDCVSVDRPGPLFECPRLGRGVVSWKVVIGEARGVSSSIPYRLTSPACSTLRLKRYILVIHCWHPTRAWKRRYHFDAQIVHVPTTPRARGSDTTGLRSLPPRRGPGGAVGLPSAGARRCLWTGPRTAPG
jgi:hypothetical protein